MSLRTNNPRLLVAAAVAIAGVVLAWRAIDRNGEPDRTPAPPPPTPAHVEQRLETGAGAMVAPTEETVTGLVSEAKAGAMAGVGAVADPPFPLDEARQRDFADAFEARLAAIVAPDFDATLEDLVARGWPRPDAQRRENMRAFYERWSGAYRLAPFAPSQVEVRALDPGALERKPTAEELAGYDLNSSTAIPSGSDGRPMRELGEVDQGLLEARLPALIDNANGEREAVLLGFCFTWDSNLETWRWVTTRVYHDPAGGAFPAIPPI